MHSLLLAVAYQNNVTVSIEYWHFENKVFRAITSKRQDKALALSRFTPKIKNKVCFVGKIIPN